MKAPVDWEDIDLTLSYKAQEGDRPNNQDTIIVTDNGRVQWPWPYRYSLYASVCVYMLLSQDTLNLSFIWNSKRHS